MATVQRLPRLDRGWITGQVENFTHTCIQNLATYNAEKQFAFGRERRRSTNGQHSSNRDGVIQWDWGGLLLPPHPACNVTSAIKRLPTRVNAFAVSICAKRSRFHG